MMQKIWNLTMQHNIQRLLLIGTIVKILQYFDLRSSASRVIENFESFE